VKHPREKNGPEPLAAAPGLPWEGDAWLYTGDVDDAAGKCHANPKKTTALRHAADLRDPPARVEGDATGPHPEAAPARLPRIPSQRGRKDAETADGGSPEKPPRSTLTPGERTRPADLPGPDLAPPASVPRV
jgi:hypothetical protein